MAPPECPTERGKARDQTYPLKYVQEVLAWNSAEAGPRAKPLRKRGELAYKLAKGGDSDYDFRPQHQKRPQVIVCHDMKGGYLDDRFYHGAANLSEEPYRFVHWPLIDTWIYFSHNLVTIPPFGWIQAAHQNGVKVLGTLITEFGHGAELCNEFLVDDDVMRKFVGKLCAIASDVGFEGWLLNIENSIDRPELVARLKRFARLLTQEMRRQCVTPHSDSQVIWYDSVTREGCLAWQNELNDHNYDFFDACDGIFLNYNWKVCEKVNSIDNSLDTLKRHDALSRNFDIYFGVDVFGRGTYGGGGFGSYKAFEAVADRTSMAIFAPGWTFEQCDPLSANPGDYFTHREYKFWKLLEPYLSSKPVALSSGDFWSISYCNGVGFCPRKGRWWLDLEFQGMMPPHLAFPFAQYQTPGEEEKSSTTDESTVTEYGEEETSTTTGESTVTKDEGEEAEAAAQCRQIAHEPFSLVHMQDWSVYRKQQTVDRNEAGGLALARCGARSRSWSFFGVPEIVPLLICQLDLSESVAIIFQVTMKRVDKAASEAAAAVQSSNGWPDLYVRYVTSDKKTRVKKLVKSWTKEEISTSDVEEGDGGRQWHKTNYMLNIGDDCVTMDCIAIQVPENPSAVIVRNISFERANFASLTEMFNARHLYP